MSQHLIDLGFLSELPEPAVGRARNLPHFSDRFVPVSSFEQADLREPPVFAHQLQIHGFGVVPINNEDVLYLYVLAELLDELFLSAPVCLHPRSTGPEDDHHWQHPIVVHVPDKVVITHACSSTDWGLVIRSSPSLERTVKVRVWIGWLRGPGCREISVMLAITLPYRRQPFQHLSSRSRCSNRVVPKPHSEIHIASCGLGCNYIAKM